MRILMAATGDFAVPTLSALPDAGHELAALITQPDRPAGRGRHVAISRVKELALAAGVAVHQPERIATPQATNLVADLAPDVLLVIAYGQKIPVEICSLPPRGALNMHGSLLPALRGAAPCNWAIVQGLKETGVTVQYLAQKMDAGDLLGTRRVAIGPRETAPGLHDRLAVLGAEVVLEVLEAIEAGSAAAVPQDESKVTLAPRLKKEDGLIDWTKPAVEIDRMVRGLKPWPGAYTYLSHRGRPDLRIILEETGPDDEGSESDAVPGTVVQSKKELVVATGRGLLTIVKLKPESSGAMSGAAFSNGHDVGPGDHFVSGAAV